MVLVRMETPVAAPGWHYERGDEVPVTAEVAADWIARGMAVPVRDIPVERTSAGRGRRQEHR